MSSGQRRPLAEAEAAIAAFMQLIEPRTCCEAFKVAGSVRRRCKTISDIELVALPKQQLGDPLAARLDRLLSEGAITKQIKSDLKTRWGPRYKALVWEGWVFEVFTGDRLNFGLQLLIRTGSADFTQGVMHRIKAGGRFRVGGGYLRPWYPDGMTEAQLRSAPALMPIAALTEQVVFDAAGLHYIDPPQRELPIPAWAEAGEAAHAV